MFMSKTLKSLSTLVLVVGFCACEKAATEHLADARAQLATSAYPQAIAAAEAGLIGGPDAVTQWGLELVILEANARAGNAEETKGQIIALASAHPDRITATDYSGTAQLLQVADAKPTAIEVLDLGVKRFPDDALLKKMIEDSVATGSSPEELQMLKSLGYIDN